MSNNNYNELSQSYTLITEQVNLMSVLNSEVQSKLLNNTFNL